MASRSTLGLGLQPTTATVWPFDRQVMVGRHFRVVSSAIAWPQREGRADSHGAPSGVAEPIHPGGR
jgi:hypothetical protein